MPWSVPCRCNEIFIREMANRPFLGISLTYACGYVCWFATRWCNTCYDNNDMYIYTDVETDVYFVASAGYPKTYETHTPLYQPLQRV